MAQGKIFKIYPTNGAVNNNLKSLHQCFLTLGAEYAEIYTGGNGYCRRDWHKLREKYCREELLEWAHNLYKKTMKAIHPDLGGEHEQAAMVNVAYERVQRILAVKRVSA